MNDPVQDRFPILVPGKIVVRNKEAAQALLHVLSNDLLDVVRRPASRFASLDIDDCAKGTLERAAAAGVEARHVTGGALSADGADERNRHSIDARQVRHEIVKWLE